MFKKKLSYKRYFVYSLNKKGPLTERDHDHLNLRPHIFPTENRVGPFETICDKTRILSVVLSLSRTRRDKFDIWG